MLKAAIDELSSGSGSLNEDDDATEGEWLFKEDDVVKGPVSAAVLVERIEGGELGADTPVAREMGKWKPLGSIGYFNDALEAAVERRRAEAELVAAKARRRNRMLVRLVSMLTVMVVPVVAGATAGYQVVKLRPWDDTQDWIQRPPPLVDLPPKPKTAPPPDPAAVAAHTPPPDPATDPEEGGYDEDDGDDGEEAAADDKKDGKGTKGKKSKKGKKGKDDKRDAKKDTRVASNAKGDKKDDKKDDKRDAKKDDKKDAKRDGKKDDKKDDGAGLRTLTQAQIMEGLNKGGAGFKRCIGTELGRNPDLPGRITIAFSVSNDGKAINFKLLERQVRDGPLADCMGKVVAKLTWPKFYGERKYVELPLNISKKK